MDLFQTATRKKYRFSTPQGSLSVEDLWSLPLQTKVRNKASLDNVGMAIREELSRTAVESLIPSDVSDSSISQELSNKFEIVKSIIAIRLDENKQSRDRAKVLDRVAFLKELKMRKKIEEDEGRSVEDIQKEIDSLSA